MAKQASDLTIEGHTNGDADGFGAVRGIRNCILLELGALVVFGFGLWLFWS